MYLYYHDKLPDYFSEFFAVAKVTHIYETRSRLNSNTNFRSIDCNKVSMQGSIRFIGPKIWEETPLRLRESRISVFKKEITNRILAKY